MKGKNNSLKTIIGITIIGAVALFSYNKFIAGAFKDVNYNYGVSNVEINGVTNSQTPEKEFSADDVVPPKDDIIKSLKDSGYKVTEYDFALNTDIPAQRVYAEKNGMFIDICYGLSKDDAVSVFSEYESSYTKYYLLSRNENYVYCISDKTTFKKSGFKGLENIGVQYIIE